jgi:hypothetical protein
MPHYKDRSRGSATVEFVLVSAFFLVPLILGLMSVGFALSRSLQVSQLTRDVGRMQVRGIDFSQISNQELITGSTSRPDMPPLARGLGMVGNGSTRNATGGSTGNGEVVLSILTRVAAGCGCTNANRIVVTRRIVVGNKSLGTSVYGNPTSSLINTTTGTVSKYTTESSARADNFSTVVDLASGEFAFLVESIFRFPDLAIAGVLPNPGVRTNAVF